MNYSAMTIQELQSIGVMGDEGAILELGRKVLDFDMEDFVGHQVCAMCHEEIG